VADKFKNKVSFSIVGNSLIAFSFIWLGPFPWFAFGPNVKLIIPSVAIAGFGEATIIVSSFARAHEAAMKSGFANNIKTNMLIAGKDMFLHLSVLYLLEL